MMNELKIICDNNSSGLNVNLGISLLELLDKVDIKVSAPIVGAYVNNKVRDLNYKLYENNSVRFIDANHFEGERILNRTLRFMLFDVVSRLFQGKEMQIMHSIGYDYYFEIDAVESNQENADNIKEELLQLSKNDLAITRNKLHHKEAESLYIEKGMTDKSRLLESSPSLYVTVNRLKDSCGYLYGVLAPSTKYISNVDVQPFYNGFHLSLLDGYVSTDSKVQDINPKMFDVMRSHSKLLDVLGVNSIGALNNSINAKQSNELIKLAEAFQEKNFTLLASQVFEKCSEVVKLLLISGPSSSGKTTFSNRLNIQLRILGLKPMILSMDNYFVDREFTPCDSKGNADFEVPEAVDIELFNSQLSALVAGEKVDIPRYDFIAGKKVWDGKCCQMDDKTILIIEGIHALNPIMTRDVDSDKKYKIYISPLTSMPLDNLSRVDIADVRLIRRLVRDAAYRNHTATQTLKRWGSVRRGEKNHILPFQKEADVLFDTFLFYELSILKSHVEPLLKSVSDVNEEFSQADRLLRILSYISDIDDKYIPPTSIIREFIGGSSFEY